MPLFRQERVRTKIHQPICKSLKRFHCKLVADSEKIRKFRISQPEWRPESQPESMNARVLSLLKDQPLGKSEISVRLGQKEVSGHLNKVIRELLAKQDIELTVPDKPNSRLQKYRLTKKGADYLKRYKK